MSTEPQSRQSEDWREAGIIHTRHSAVSQAWPVPIRAVQLTGGFWRQFTELNRTTLIPSLFEKLKTAGRLDNFLIASGQKDGETRGRDARDSDLHKWLEGASHQLQNAPDAQLAQDVQTVADAIAAAQEPNGYLNTAFMGERASLRHTNLRHGHELYVAGHFIQAAVAHHRATGSRQLLDVATKLADYLCGTFRPGGIGATSGHPCIEMALVELYRTTLTARYLDLVAFLIDRRGSAFPEADLRQRQALVDHKPFRDLTKLTGTHAVRSLYLVSGVTDLYLERGDLTLLATLQTLWEDTVTSKMYVTGGLGARYQHESFGEDYELPNLQAYAETCAAVANIFWNQRMSMIEPRAVYMDILEGALYNGTLPGISLDAKTFFYANPLETHDHGDEELPSRSGVDREPWFETTCCPTNMVRLLASLPGYFYSLSREGVYVHLYNDSVLDWHLADGTPLQIQQHTAYPWDGQVQMQVRVNEPTSFTLFLRIPTWSRSSELAVNGESVGEIRHGSYHAIHRTWKTGDTVSLTLRMPPRFMSATPRLREVYGCYTLARGPLIYCLEGIDNPGVANLDVHWKVDAGQPEAGLMVSDAPDLLSGITVIQGAGFTPEMAMRDLLYHPIGKETSELMHEVELTAIPYYARANRGRSWMKVWVPYRHT